MVPSPIPAALPRHIAMRISEALLLSCAILVAGTIASRAQEARIETRALPPASAPAGAGALVNPLAAPGLGAATVPLVPFSSVKDALRAGVRDYKAGDKASAVQALQFAAGQGHLAAQWKLGKMYADGDGVPADDLKAFEYFSKLADDNADETPGTADGRAVSDAFMALGHYFTTGIKGTYVKPSAPRAYEMFYYAASYFRDPVAQFHLARMHLDGKGAPLDPIIAARWLKLAAEKGHGASQAVLGTILTRGTGVPKQVGEGLMWLTLAKGTADAERDGWIIEAHGKAYESASESDRSAAQGFLKQFIKRQK
jgi:uncharacterized protein